MLWCCHASSFFSLFQDLIGIPDETYITFVYLHCNYYRNLSCLNFCFSSFASVDCLTRSPTITAIRLGPSAVFNANSACLHFPLVIVVRYGHSSSTTTQKATKMCLYPWLRWLSDSGLSLPLALEQSHNTNAVRSLVSVTCIVLEVWKMNEMVGLTRSWS